MNFSHSLHLTHSERKTKNKYPECATVRRLPDDAYYLRQKLTVHPAKQAAPAAVLEYGTSEIVLCRSRAWVYNGGCAREEHDDASSQEKCRAGKTRKNGYTVLVLTPEGIGGSCQETEKTSAVMMDLVVKILLGLLSQVFLHFLVAAATAADRWNKSKQMPEF